LIQGILPLSHPSGSRYSPIILLKELLVHFCEPRKTSVYRVVFKKKGNIRPKDYCYQCHPCMTHNPGENILKLHIQGVKEKPASNQTRGFKISPLTGSPAFPENQPNARFISNSSSLVNIK
jgi:hypothetical protein